VIRDDAGLRGVAGLEPRPPHGLLRSLAVRADARRAGDGRRLVARVVEDAVAEGLVGLWLLTDDAEGYFARHGFARVPRESAPPHLLASAEFRTPRCGGAALMHRPCRPAGGVGAGAGGEAPVHEA
jgi:amino-acid N-acetyltransferase